MGLTHTEHGFWSKPFAVFFNFWNHVIRFVPFTGKRDTLWRKAQQFCRKDSQILTFDCSLMKNWPWFDYTLVKPNNKQSSKLSPLHKACPKPWRTLVMPTYCHLQKAPDLKDTKRIHQQIKRIWRKVETLQETEEMF